MTGGGFRGIEGCTVHTYVHAPWYPAEEYLHEAVHVTAAGAGE
jgi:hypothetical protein